MKYLVIGDANSMHIYNYVKNVLLKFDFEIHLMTLSTECVRQEYQNFYKVNNVILHSLAQKKIPSLRNKSIKDRLLNFYLKYKLLDEVGKIDICHIQSVYKTSIFFYLLKRKNFNHFIASYWGGDIENLNSLVVKIRKIAFSFADVITVTTLKTYNEFKELYGNIFDNKLQICRMATEGLDWIHNISQAKTIRDCRKELDLPLDKVIITCGYSAYADQHQDIILDMISKLSAEIKRNIYVIVPMQYGRYNKTYIKKVEEKAQRVGCEYKILEEYFSFEKNAKLTISTDIYLHMRDTDAFSNSLKEHVYAGTRIIIGNWLKYYELEQMEAPVNYVDSFEQLPLLLEKLILESIHEGHKKYLFSPMYVMYSQDGIQKQWCEILSKIIK